MGTWRSFRLRIGASLWSSSFNNQQWKSLRNERKTKMINRVVLTSDVDQGNLIFEGLVFEEQHADPNSLAAIILGGGVGTQLFPLTSRRAKLVVPIGGRHRLIDVPMSNCIIRSKIKVISRY